MLPYLFVAFVKIGHISYHYLSHTRTQIPKIYRCLAKVFTKQNMGACIETINWHWPRQVKMESGLARETLLTENYMHALKSIHEQVLFYLLFL